VVRDVTERLRAQGDRLAAEAAVRANQAKTEFLSRMSHELRTPLNAVLGFAQLLEREAMRMPHDWRGNVRHIVHAGTHLLHLIDEVLDLSRIEAGGVELKLRPVPLAEVIDDSLAVVRPAAARRGVALQAASTLEDSRLSVIADATRLHQVLVNLLDNAVKYTPAGGLVWIDAQAAHDEALGPTVVLEVGDTGVGLDADQLGHLFEPFNRLGAEKSNIEGTGIGLVLSRRLVELMEGDLLISSKLGLGTVATLLLKATEAPSTRPRPQLPPSQHGPLGASLRVLYAEDDEVNVELIRQVLSLRPAVELRVATNGARALEMARRDPPDLMLVDMNLGDMTGIELAGALQESPQTADLRLVALSADALPEQISATLAAGFETYLTKPVDFRKFLEVLDGHLNAEV